MYAKLNVIKKAIITYYPFPGSSIKVDLSCDGSIAVDDNGISRSYEVDKGTAKDIIHNTLINIFFMDLPEEKSIIDDNFDWKIEFYNSKHLDHIICGTKETPSDIHDDLLLALHQIERCIHVDLGIEHMESITDARKEDYGKSAVVSEEMRSIYFHVMAGLLREIAIGTDNHDINILLSPLSLINAMAMAMEASDGETLNEISAFFDNKYEQIAEGLCAINIDCSRSNSQLKAANALFIDRGFAKLINDNYCEVISSKLYAELFSADSKNYSQMINDWVSMQTNGLIKELVDGSTDLGEITLLNALAFDAEWQRKYFDEDVIQNDFFNADGSVSSVNMLCGNEDRFMLNSKVTGFLKPYKNREYYFAGILPNEGFSTDQILKEMSADEWRMLFDRTRKAEVKTMIPEYEVNYDKNITSILAELGVSSVFKAGKADLRKMTSAKDAYINKVIQKSYIDVNRMGTRAAVVTGMVVAAAGKPQEHYEVYLNRPFIYAIVHASSGLPVFIGTVNKLEDLKREK